MENRLALFNEGLDRLTVILCQTAVYVVSGFQIETVIDLTSHCPIEIFLHIAKRYRRA